MTFFLKEKVARALRTFRLNDTVAPLDAFTICPTDVSRLLRISQVLLAGLR